MEKKLRHSRQRDRIYEYLTASKEHPSAEMVYQDLRPEIPGLSLGTVYRNLKLLEELGKVRRVTSFQGTERYDACCGDHAHFLCERCGLLHDLGIANSQAIRDIIVLDDGFTLSKLDLTVTGLCPNCGG
ncbi:MAG: transcriptional repressor [Oscillospiraceae bacterium]|nr:transcriptional repressor [Oscillospiraceae bacterium]